MIHLLFCLKNRLLLTPFSRWIVNCFAWKKHLNYQHMFVCYFCERMEITTTKIIVFFATLALILCLLLLLHHNDSLVLHDSRVLIDKTKSPFKRRYQDASRVYQDRSERVWNLCKTENVPASKNVPLHIQYIHTQKVSYGIKSSKS